MTDWRRPIGGGAEAAVRRTAVSAELPVLPSAAMLSRRRSVAGLLATAGVLLAGCSGNSTFFQSTPTPQTQTTEAPPPPSGGTVGAGEVKAALILPVSASGNAGIAGQAMRNAAEMALAEFNAPNVQLLVN
jgi:branched-chain amino acid transport system substrate-binding protein